jgi:hypothetical protein
MEKLLKTRRMKEIPPASTATTVYTIQGSISTCFSLLKVYTLKNKYSTCILVKV